MTLILSCLTNDAVYQVSDRRLTRCSPKHELVDEESNKALYVDGRVAFGYTGIAQIGNANTVEWLAQTIASKPVHDMGQISEHIRTHATAAFRRMSFASRYKRHAFQRVGWFLLPSSSTLQPGIVTIHNALDAKGEWLAYAKREFEVSTKFFGLNSRQFFLDSVGLRPTKDERGAIYRLVRKCVHRRHGRHPAILGALAIAIRWLSKRYEPDSPIGRNLMGLCLPKSSAEACCRTGEFFALASKPNGGTATFLDLAEFRRPVSYGPMAVNGSTVILGFRCGPVGQF